MTSDFLSPQALMEHIRALADVIGGRPAGGRGEMQARQYIRHALKDAGVDLPVDEVTFTAPDSYGYVPLIAAGVVLIGNLLGKRLRLMGGAMSLLAAYSVAQLTVGRRSPFTPLVSSGDSANLVVKIPAKGTPKHRVVLIGHTDTSKHRLTFTPGIKHLLRSFSTFSIVLAIINALAQFLGLKALRRWTAAFVGVTIPMILADELGGFVDGANDNATAVACLLGLGAHLNANRLENTEIWLAFTGAEEVGCVGIHQLLDTYRVEVANAWFIDFEMVGAGQLAYVTEHSSMLPFSTYTPDDESLVLAIETAMRHPELNIVGSPMTMVEEVGALRSRGFRAICLTGIGEDGWLVNLHQSSDVAANIDAGCVANAAQFALAMIEAIDERPLS